MGLSKSSRPQNLHPDALIQSRKEVAHRNEEAVRVTVQAMQRRKTDPRKITVQAVAKEAGVSMATIYRRDTLLLWCEKQNPLSSIAKLNKCAEMIFSVYKRSWLLRKRRKTITRKKRN